MRYPLDNFLGIPRTYEFGDPTFYGTKHLGVDYIIPVGTAIYAPSNGQILVESEGPEAGKRIEFKDENNKYIRFLHLSEFKKPVGTVKEGDVIARSGNTGSVTTTPHLHLDISNVYPINISVFSNFIDPDKYFKEHVDFMYDDHIIRNRDTGAFAYVVKGKKQQISTDKAGIALMTFLDRLKTGIFPQDWIVNVDTKTWNSIPDTTTKFF